MAPRFLALVLLAACSVKPVALSSGTDAAPPDQGGSAEAAAVPPDAAPPLEDAPALAPDVAADAEPVPDLAPAIGDAASDDVPAPVPDAAVDRTPADRRIPPDIPPDPIDPEPDAAPPPDLMPDVAVVRDVAVVPDLALLPDLAPDLPEATPDLGVDSGASAHGRELVFVANQDSNDLSVFSVDAVTGARTTVTGSPFATGERPFHLAITPDGKFLYACHYGTEDLRGFRVADTGKLTPVPAATVAIPHPEMLVMAGGGRALYAYGIDGLLYGFTVDGTTGALNAVTGSPFAGVSMIQGLAADPKGRYLAVTMRTDSAGAGLLRLYAIEAGGTLHQLTEVTAPGNFAADSPALTFDPGGDFIYGEITVSGGGDRVFGFAVPAPGGAFTPIPGTPWLGVSEGAIFTFHPGRPLLYHAGTSELRVFTRAANGSLTEVSGSPVIAFNNDTGASVSSVGTFLYVLFQSENEITVSRIAESGLPVPFPGSPWKVGTNPYDLVVWAPPLQ
jgi:DNA-binding beta-propeller fold protein YncE